MKIIFVRHGMTQGNIDKKYIGRTDQPLTAEGAEMLKKIEYPRVDKVYASPMKRCIETAGVIFPKEDITVVEDLREIDFGIFEDKTHYELVENAYYQKWLNNGGLSDIPEGEGFEAFRQRCVRAFKSVIADEKAEAIAFVIHGGTIMALMSGLFDMGYFDAMVGNGRGYILSFENNSLKITGKI